MWSPLSNRPAIVRRAIVLHLAFMFGFALPVSILNLFSGRWGVPESLRNTISIALMGFVFWRALAYDRLGFRALRLAGNLCEHCAYPLSTEPQHAICPECGHPYNILATRERWVREMPKGWYARLGLRLGRGN